MNILKKLKFLIAIAILIFIVLAVFVYPTISFKSGEKLMVDAAKRYFEVNPSQAPTGTRVKTLTLQDLYNGQYIKEDIYIPYTDTPCDLKKSWVKLRKENGNEKYYVYLKCGPIDSNVDHDGPEITLNGKEEMIITRGDKFKDPGYSKVYDKNDGTITDVTVKGKVNTNKVGTYTIEYSAYDKLLNKNVVTRKVIVKEYLKNVVKDDVKDKKYYTDLNANNYVRISNMTFRMIGFDGDNIRAVSDVDLANINYDGIEKWLDYFEKNLQKNSLKYLVKAKYCKATSNIDSTECSETTNSRYSYIPSNIDVLNANGTYMRPLSVSWVINTKDDERAYITKDVFVTYNEDKTFVDVKKSGHYGIRPMITINGNNEILDGNGTAADPYVFNDVTPAVGGEYLNTRLTGEYVMIGGLLFRIIDVEKDGTTKVIAMSTLYDRTSNVLVAYDNDPTVYNPNKNRNIGSQINNQTSKYLDSSYFVNHKITVPIYEKELLYGKEIDKKEYTVKFSAPNMFELFSAYDGYTEKMGSFWYTNSSKTTGYCGAVYDAGSTVNDMIPYGRGFGIRPVAFVTKKAIITSGAGTMNSPYVIKK